MTGIFSPQIGHLGSLKPSRCQLQSALAFQITLSFGSEWYLMEINSLS